MAHIELQNIYLSYPIYGSYSRDFKSSLINFATGGLINNDHRTVQVEALRDISLSLKQGDRLALIGHNGAGKSSLLKVIAKVYHPTRGKIDIKGKTNSLFDIMMGMDPELNGYENIILRSRIAGLSKTEALELIPKVEEFSELGHFMKMPFKTYSSGMQLRLAFGIITNIPAEIVLIDEIINVGDASFFAKAQKQINKLIDQSEILVISTHDLSAAEAMCNKALWLEHGNFKEFGSIYNVFFNFKNIQQNREIDES